MINGRRATIIGESSGVKYIIVAMCAHGWSSLKTAIWHPLVSFAPPDITQSS